VGQVACWDDRDAAPVMPEPLSPDHPTAAPPSPRVPHAGLVGLDAVRRAAERIHAVANVTPLLALRPGVHVKAESLQVTGSFKFRGAFNALASELEAGEVSGVVCHSSGNHAQGVARAARLLGVPAVAVMPSDAPAVKAQRVAREGAEIVRVGSSSDERVSVAVQLAAERGLVLLSSTEHPDVIAGQGTVGLEIVEACLAMPEVGPELRAAHGAGLEVFVPVGGGGLASGVALAVRTLLPRAAVVGVEPETAADARESLEQGRIVRWPVERVMRTVADGVRHTAVGPLAFAHLRRYIDRIATATEDQIASAMRVLAAEGRLVVEPSGALAPAAALAGAATPGRHIVCVASGGNVDLRAYARVVAGGDAGDDGGPVA